MLARVQPKLNDKDYLELHVQEYIALRSEQRTRLDSANKIIHYSAILIAAVIAGLLTIYKNEKVSPAEFTKVFQNVLLIFPLLAMPFALTQQNEEIIVRRIGDYFDEIKGKITKRGDLEYWNWDIWHNINEPPILLVSAFFRAGLLIIFSVISLGIYIFYYHTWPDNAAKWILLIADLALLAVSISIAYVMAKKRLEVKAKRTSQEHLDFENI